jgi:hypothetical protein
MVIFLDIHLGLLYIYIMKNLDMLKTGSKRSPGQLAVIQGFVNTLNIETGIDDIGSKELLKKWLVFHGLLKPADRVSFADFRTTISLREALRSLLLTNNGNTFEPSSLKNLNKLFSKFPLAVYCERDGKPSLISSKRGMAGVFGFILSQVIQAVNDGTWSQLKACSDTNCQWAFYDNSKNHSGKWCAMSVCGSREKARAYRRRRSLK